MFDDDKMRAFEIIGRIAFEVGKHYGVFLQLNFPPGRNRLGAMELGRRDLSMLVYRDKKKFDSVSESEVKIAFEQLNPLSFEPVRQGQEGFKARLSNGRIDCLPGGVHLWCELTRNVLEVLDWLFENVYGIAPS